MSYWQFSPIPNIEESNFNKILERFYNLKVAGLIRENIQNSLDGRLLGSEGPVTVLHYNRHDQKERRPWD